MLGLEKKEGRARRYRKEIDEDMKKDGCSRANRWEKERRQLVSQKPDAE